MNSVMINLDGSVNGLQGEFLLWDFDNIKSEDKLMITECVANQDFSFFSRIINKYGMDVVPLFKTAMDKGVDIEVIKEWYSLN